MNFCKNNNSDPIQKYKVSKLLEEIFITLTYL